MSCIWFHNSDQTKAICHLFILHKSIINPQKNWAEIKKTASQASVYDSLRIWIYFQLSQHCRATSCTSKERWMDCWWSGHLWKDSHITFSVAGLMCGSELLQKLGWPSRIPRWELCGAFWEISTTGCQPVCWTPAQRLSQEQDKLLHCPQTTPKLSVTSKNRTKTWGYQKHVLCIFKIQNIVFSHLLFAFQYEFRLTFWLLRQSTNAF